MLQLSDVVIVSVLLEASSGFRSSKNVGPKNLSDVPLNKLYSCQSNLVILDSTTIVNQMKNSKGRKAR